MIRSATGEAKPVRISRYEQVRECDLAAEVTIPETTITECRRWLEQSLSDEVRKYRERRDILARHREIGEANKAFIYLLAMGMLRSARNRPNVTDPERLTQVVSEAREMAEEDRRIIIDMQIDKMSENQKRELIVHLGAELYAGQWRSAPHFRKAAMHVVTREMAVVKRNHKGETTTTHLIDQLGRKAETLLSVRRI